MAILAVFCQMALAQKVTVDLSSTGPELSPYMYGIFYEDINYAADGGLNSELVQNASFEYFQFYTSNSPEPVAPVTREIRSGKNFSAEAPAWSVQIIRLSINQ